MKYLSKLLVLSIFVFALGSCEKDENRIYFEGGTPPVLSSSVTGMIPISFVNADKEAIKLSWTNPNYEFTTGGSSQDVNYLIEIDTTGANFTNPKRRTLAIRSSLTKTITQGELNDYLLNTLELRAGTPHNIEMRVTSSLSGNAVSLSSNVLKFTVTPYAIPPKVTPPTNGTLWITGSAVGSSWANPIPAAFETQQKFTKVSDTKYELVVAMIPGGGYKLIQTQGDWSTQYSFIKGSGDALGGEFEKRDGTQFDAPAAAGTYKLTVDFQTGKFTAVKQ
ncbi:MAG TPA: SusE domain-containing protein [Chitinophagaceae bacterium]|nr:SusE domain-containing protein [Chitinophagaceae bacterium]